MPLSGRDARIRITSQVATSSTDVACTATTGAAGNVQITSTAQRHIDPDTTPVLYRAAAGSTAVESSTKYSVNFVQGKFEYKAGQTVSTGTYTADIEYLTASNIAGARQWSLNVEQEMFEVSEFGSSGWREFQPNLVGANVSLSRYWNTGITAGATDAFLDLIDLNAQFLLELEVSNTNGWKYEGYCYPSQNTIQASVDNIVSEDLNLVVNGQLYFSTE